MYMSQLKVEEQVVVHVCSKAEWTAAQVIGSYEPSSLKTEGFIHLSKPDQILRVANQFFSTQKDLVLLWIHAARLSAELRWESPPLTDPNHGEMFPHLYGSLNLDSVDCVVDFRPDLDGVFREIPGLFSS